MKKIAVIVFFAFACVKMQAGARLNITIDSFQSTVLLADTNTRNYIYYIHNTGDTAYTGVISLGYAVNGTTYPTNNYSQGLYAVSDSVTILPGDSVAANMQVHYNLSVWQVVGSSAVVIWPITAPGQSALIDSMYYTVIISPTSTINDLNHQSIKIMQQGAVIYVKYEEEISVKRVRIYDINGRLIENNPWVGPAIAFNHAGGCYIMELLFNDNSRETFKLVNID